VGQPKNRYSTRPPNRKKGRKFSLPIVSAAAVGAVLLIAMALFLISRRDNEASGSTREFDPDFTPEVTDAPRVEVLQDTIDHGNVKLGSTVQSVFRVRNVGDQPLQILGEPQVEVLEGC